jgi:lambda family phage portal protein
MWGRPQIKHIFDGYPGQMRGMPPLTPALRIVRQFDQLADATLTAALIQAIFAATITSPSPTQEILQAFQDTVEQKLKANQTPPSPLEAMWGFRQGFYQGTQIDLGSHGKIAHLAPGDTLAFQRSEHPNDTYEPFVNMLLREMARCIGVTFEQLTGNYAGATYSSVRMATSEIWMITIYRRINIITPFYQTMYQAWLEEEIDKGWIPFPGGLDAFTANRAAACRAHWRGPAKPQADDQKFAKAVETLRGIGVVTDEWICGEMGEDWLDVYEQRALEMSERKRLGLPEVVKVVLNDPDDIQNAEAAIEVEDAKPTPPAPVAPTKKGN